MFGLTGYAYIEHSRLTNNGVEADGVVRRISEKNGKYGSVRHIAEIEFSDADNNRHTVNSESVDPFQVGQKIKMVYWKTDPKVAERVDSPKLVQRTYRYVFGVGVILLGVLGWNFYVFRRNYA